MSTPTEPRRFVKRRWRRPERMTLDHGPVVRRKDLGVSEPLPLETELARRTSRNQIQVLLASFALLCAIEGLIVGLVTGRGWIVAVAFLAFGALYFVVAREFGDSWIVRTLQATEVEVPRVLRLAASEARVAGIPSPRVLAAPGDVPNALSFALRRRWIVTTTACSSLDELALEALLAHEIIHLRDGESTVASLYVALAGGPDLVLRGAGALAFLSVPLWPAALALRAVRSIILRGDRELRADVAAAMLTRYPPGLVDALRVCGGRPAGLRLMDAFWFVARDAGRAPEADADRRAQLVSEM